MISQLKDHGAAAVTAVDLPQAAGAVLLDGQCTAAAAVAVSLAIRHLRVGRTLCDRTKAPTLLFSCCASSTAGFKTRCTDEHVTEVHAPIRSFSANCCDVLQGCKGLGRVT